MQKARNLISLNITANLHSLSEGYLFWTPMEPAQMEILYQTLDTHSTWYGIHSLLVWLLMWDWFTPKKLHADHTATKTNKLINCNYAIGSKFNGQVCRVKWHVVVSLQIACDWISLCSPSPSSKHVGEPMVAVKLAENALRGRLQSQCLVCPFLITVKPWWWNMADSMEEDLIPLLI